MTEKKSTTVGWTVAAAGFGFALVQLDVTIVNVALPDIAKALGTDVAGLQWVIDAYALTFAAFLLTAGFPGDRLGARKIYLTGFGIFAVASLACGLAGLRACCQRPCADRGACHPGTDHWWCTHWRSQLEKHIPRQHACRGGWSPPDISGRGDRHQARVKQLRFTWANFSVLSRLRRSLAR